MGIYFGDKKLGFSHTAITLTDDGIKVNSRVYLRFHAAGIDQVTSFSQETRLTRDLQVKSFSLLQEISGNRQKIDGRRAGDKMILDVSTLGYRKEKSIAFPGGTVLAGTYLLDILKNGLRVGEKGTWPLFLEPMQIVTQVKYEILREETIPFDGRKVKTYVVRQEISGMGSTLWITPDGRMIRERSREGFESRSEPQETAQKLDGEAMAVSSFITLSLVKTQKKIFAPDKKKMIKLKLMNIRSPDAIPQDHRQKVLKVEAMAKKSRSEEHTSELQSH